VRNVQVVRFVVKGEARAIGGRIEKKDEKTRRGR
jgi:hypothetical protein